MRASEILTESKSKPLIVVDVQPAYEEWIDFDLDEMARFLSDRQGPVLMFVNADETGMTEDSIPEIQYWWAEIFERNKLDPEVLNSYTWFDKGYGYLRSWMDNDIYESEIIKAIREMYQQKVTSSDELFDGDRDQILEFITGPEWVIMDDPIHVEWVGVGMLRKYNNCFLCGGGRNECLKEVQLLMNAFNIKYKLLDRFIYG